METFSAILHVNNVDEYYTCASQNIDSITNCYFFARFGVDPPRLVHSDDDRLNSDVK